MVNRVGKSKKQEKSIGSKKLHAASFSFFVNLGLIIFKGIVFFLTGSIAILAESLHSLFDLLASVFAYIGIKHAEKPADAEHLYGHEKYENLSSLAQTILIVITSIVILNEAAKRIHYPKTIEFLWAGIAVTIVAIIADLFISRYLHKASEKFGSHALEAGAYHFTTDLWSSTTVLAGFIFVYLGFPMFDSIAAIVVALMMLWISYKLAVKSINILMDKAPSNEVIEKVGRIIMSFKSVKVFHKLRARHAGNKILVQFHIHISEKKTVKQGHMLAHKMKERIMKEISGVKDVLIHVEPYNPKYKCKEK